MRGCVWLLAGCFLVGAIGLEFFARCRLGLGDPPLSEASSDLDYIFKPNQRCCRFGNRIWYNNVSMRVDFDVDNHFSGRRLFVVGDSVVNGGALTDQDELATSILQRELPDWQVCNVSAGSWGPGNCAAYFRRHPWLVRNGDVLVLQLNGHDLWEDDPRDGAGKIVGTKDFPEERPILAVWDGWSRYAWPRFRAKFVKTKVNRKIDIRRTQEDVAHPLVRFNLDACRWMYELPFRDKVLLVFRSRAEAKSGIVSKGEEIFVNQAREVGVAVLYSDLTVHDYRDSIHPNASGQKKMAELILKEIKR